MGDVGASGSAVHPPTWIAPGCLRATSRAPCGPPHATRFLVATISCETATYPALPGHAVPSPEIRPASRWPMMRLRIAPRYDTGTNGFMLWIDIFHAMRFAVALKSALG